jgi:hypothetical protein
MKVDPGDIVTILGYESEWRVDAVTIGSSLALLSSHSPNGLISVFQETKDLTVIQTGYTPEVSPYGVGARVELLHDRVFTITARDPNLEGTLICGSVPFIDSSLTWEIFSEAIVKGENRDHLVAVGEWVLTQWGPVVIDSIASAGEGPIYWGRTQAGEKHMFELLDIRQVNPSRNSSQTEPSSYIQDPTVRSKAPSSLLSALGNTKVNLTLAATKLERTYVVLTGASWVERDWQQKEPTDVVGVAKYNAKLSHLISELTDLLADHLGEFEWGEGGELVNYV